MLKATQKTELPLVPASELFVDPKIAEEGPAAIFAQKIPIEERLGQGRLDPVHILEQCPMFAEARRTGGEKVGQPVWHQQALAATFLLGGRELFHNLSCKHPTYSRADTDDMFDRKLRDRLAKGLGYPSCVAFERDGAEQCKTCPLKGKITSPLNIKAGEVVELFPELVEFKSPFYWEDGSLCRGSGKSKEVILMSRIFKKGTRLVKDERGEGHGLLVTFSSGLGEQRSVVLSSEDLTNQAACITKLSKGGCATMSKPTPTTEAMCSLRGRLMREQKAQRAVPFGWVFKDRREGEEDQDEPIGFAYGGKAFYADRTEETYGANE